MKLKIEKAIILAAGMGSRLGSLTNNLPKCLLQVAGKSILGSQLECLEKNGVAETAIVVGYMKDRIVNQVGNQFGRMKISYVENNIYDKTNNIYSLWLARSYLENGCFLLEADTIFEEKVFKPLIDLPQRNIAILDAVRDSMTGAIVELNPDSSVKSFVIVSKDQTAGFDYRNKFKTVNLYKFSPELGLKIGFRLDAYIRSGRVHDFHEMVLREIVTEGQIPLYGVSIAGKKWVEVDTVEDLEMAKGIFRS